MLETRRRGRRGRGKRRRRGRGRGLGRGRAATHLAHGLLLAAGVLLVPLGHVGLDEVVVRRRRALRLLGG
jgi:hypothetical protein